jgi:gamma-glutamylcyclotransferase (GGCT)/AIG2-like uncharacterized protein YtfP
MPAYLFVYGSLLPGLRPPALGDVLAGCIDRGPGSLPGRLYDLGPYPAAVLDPRAATHVQGRVFELPADRDVLAELDRYEGFDPANPADSLYVRVARPVNRADGGCVVCWVYVYNRDPGAAAEVPDGDYAAWRVRPGDSSPQ